MSRIADSARELLVSMRSLEALIQAEGMRILNILKTHKEELEFERASVQEEINRLQPVVEADLAPESDKAEYIILLHRRRKLDTDYKEVIETAAQIELPDTDVKIWQKVTLDGEAVEVAE